MISKAHQFTDEQIMAAAKAATLYFTDLSFQSGMKDSHGFYPYKGRVKEKLREFLQALGVDVEQPARGRKSRARA